MRKGLEMEFKAEGCEKVDLPMVKKCNSINVQLNSNVVLCK